jgi:hypothetical protein
MRTSTRGVHHLNLYSLSCLPCSPITPPLQVAEDTLREISKHLLNFQAKRTLLAFALCCQRYKSVGLDTLWSTMSSLNPLIKLASIIFSLFHDSQVDNMTVLDQYAFRIIRLTINPAQNIPLLSAAQFQEIQEKKAGLLPNLRELELSWSPLHTPGRRCSVLIPSILRGARIVSIWETIPVEFPHRALNCVSFLCAGVGCSIHQLSLQGDLPHNVSSLQALVQLKTFSLSNTKKSSVSPLSLLTALSTIQGLRSLSLSLWTKMIVKTWGYYNSSFPGPDYYLALFCSTTCLSSSAGFGWTILGHGISHNSKRGRQ